MLVKIISGGYGFFNGNTVDLKTKDSAPFDVSAEEADRLVSLGIAKMVETAVATVEKKVVTVEKTNDKAEEKTSKKPVSARNRADKVKLTAEMPE